MHLPCTAAIEGFGHLAPRFGVVQVPPGLPIVERVRQRDLEVEGGGLAAGHVVSGREVLSRRAQHDDLDVGILIGGLPGLVELQEDLLALGIGGLGPIERYDPDVVLDLELNVLQVHVSS